MDDSLARTGQELEQHGRGGSWSAFGHCDLVYQAHHRWQSQALLKVIEILGV